MGIIQLYCQINGYPVAKKTSSINCWKENLNTCFSFSWKIVPSNQDNTSRTLGCCKIQIVLKNQRNISNVFHFKEISRTFSVLKIVDLPISCLVLSIGFSKEDAVLPIMVKLTGTWK